MIVQYASDLHLEFPHNNKFIRQNPLKPKGDVCILAGDIVNFAAIDDYGDFWNYLSENFALTYWIPGNHEYYGYDIAQRSGTLHEAIRKNVFLVNNVVVPLENVSFIFTTLWSKVDPHHEYAVQIGLNDFRVIRKGGAPFLVRHFNQLHEESLDFLTQALHTYQHTKRVVVTHHVPTFMNYPELYRGDVLNQGFATELQELIESIGPRYWIYGHHHNNTPAFDIGRTTLVTNQLGYLLYKEMKDFDGGKCVEV